MKVYKKIMSLMLVIVLITGLLITSPSASAVTNPKATIEITATCNYEWAFEVLRLVNEHRAQEGLHPYEMNYQMMQDAMQRSAELAVNYSHMRPDGTPCFTINDDAWAENIAVLFGSPEQVVNGWMQSSGHRANIMSEDFEVIGIGIVIHNDIPCWTQLFGLSDSEVASATDEILEKDFSIYLGDNQYEIELVSSETTFLTDKEKIMIRGKNLDGGLYFIINSDNVNFSSDNSDIVAIVDDTIIGKGLGKATITAQSDAFTVSKEIEILKFGAEKSHRCGDNITWDYNDKTLTLTGYGRMYDYNTNTDFYTGFSTDVPWEDGFENVNKIIIGEGITYIGNTAFSEFTALTEVVLPSTLIEIGNYAFQNCTQLTSIFLPDSISSLGDGVFSRCYELRSINIPEGITKIPTNLFELCCNITELTLPSSLESIGSYAFYDCNKLQNITLPENLKSIGSGAFYGCTSLRDITIPCGVTELQKNTFKSCDSLTNITVENPVLMFGADDLFSALSEQLTLYGYRNSSTEKYCIKNNLKFLPLESNKINAKVQGNSKLYDNIPFVDELRVMFESTPDEYSIVYSNGENFDFSNHYSSIEELYKAYKPSDSRYLTDCGTYPVSYCIYSKGTEPLTGNACIVIEKAATEFTFEKTSVELPYYTQENNYGNIINPITNIGILNEYDIRYTSDNTSVAEVTTGGYVYATGIGECTITASYSGSNNLSSHSVSYKVSTYPVGRYQIGDYVFDFKKDKSATLFDYYGDDTVITVPTEALGYNISEISRNTFYSAIIEEANIPDGITLVGENAFLSCTKLSKVNISDTVSTIDEYAFYYCKSLTEITIPKGVRAIMSNAFAGCNNMDSVIIPSTVEYIGEKAFGYTAYYFSGELEKNKDFVIYGYKDTAAEIYAIENGFEFIPLNSPVVPSYELGDVNRDENVNVRDATAIQKNIAGLLEFDIEQTALADFNQDNNVNIKDATAIQKKIAGII